jgi:hypothetical protein
MATNTNSLLNSVPKLNGQNYHDWKFAISMVLRHSGCWDVITEKVTASTRDAQSKAEEGLTSIGLTIEPSQYQYIRDCSDGIDAWKALKKVYEKNSRANRIALKRQFYGYIHDIEQSIQVYITGVTGLATRLKAIGVKLEDADIMDVLLFNLDQSWSNIAATLCATTDELNVIADVTGPLLDEEGRRGGPPNGDTEAAMFSRTRRTITCYNCQKQGHISRDCKEPRKGQNEQKEDEEHAHLATDELQSSF